MPAGTLNCKLASAREELKKALRIAEGNLTPYERLEKALAESDRIDYLLEKAREGLVPVQRQVRGKHGMHWQTFHVRPGGTGTMPKGVLEKKKPAVDQKGPDAAKNAVVGDSRPADLIRNNDTFKSLMIRRIKELDSAITRGYKRGSDWDVSRANEQNLGLRLMQEFMRGKTPEQAAEIVEERRKSFIREHNAEHAERNKELRDQARRGNTLAAQKIRELDSQWGRTEIKNAREEIETAISLTADLAAGRPTKFLNYEIKPREAMPGKDITGADTRFGLYKESIGIFNEAADLAEAVTQAYQERSRDKKNNRNRRASS